jgi:hypothetical protein
MDEVTTIQFLFSNKKSTVGGEFLPTVFFLERFEHQGFGTLFFICTLSEIISLVVKIIRNEATQTILPQ